MLTRSQSGSSSQLVANVQIVREAPRPRLKALFCNVSEDIQARLVGELFKKIYGYPARPKQIESVINLINGRTTFLLAGTGFGKSRIPELLYHMYEEADSPIVLSMNPLDSLGDDQVLEKSHVNLKAINMTGGTCTRQACEAILRGEYTFIYVSPEVALTNTIFSNMFLDRRFQSRLILKVVDEAHMIYMWGLVKSGQAKKMSSFARIQDTGVFRPHYGDLARRFLATDKVPLLLMSATCTPQAIQAILANLKIDPQDIEFTRAELTRPELRLIRRTFKRPLKSSLKGVFTHHSVVSTDELPPTLIYAGTQNATLDFLRIINSARGHLAEAKNGLSAFARRYHATTGARAKISAVEAYIAGALAIMCCTLALGLGQNWHRVRRVIVVGRHDPCNFFQMAGRCGRDGRRGLALLLVENIRTNGKNRVEDFHTPTVMTDDDRMDALGITPVCLRVALAVDLAHGYIPLDPDAWVVQEEESRQLAAGMPSCDCSNCLPEEAEALWLAQKALTVDNFDEAMQSTDMELNQMVDDLPVPPAIPEGSMRPEVLRCSAEDEIRTSDSLKSLVTKWIDAFEELFFSVFSKDSDLGPWDYFSPGLAWDLAKNIDLFHQCSDLTLVLTGEIVDGQYATLFQTFGEWQADEGSMEAISKAVQRRKAVRRNGPSKPPVSAEGAELLKIKEAAEKLAIKQAKLAEKEYRQSQKAELATEKKLRIEAQTKEREQLAELKQKEREDRKRLQADLKAQAAAKRVQKAASKRKRPATSPTHSTTAKHVKSPQNPSSTVWRRGAYD